jgi:hypothetical protein
MKNKTKIDVILHGPHFAGVKSYAALDQCFKSEYGFNWVTGSGLKIRIQIGPGFGNRLDPVSAK